jgi:hypothetical protein
MSHSAIVHLTELDPLADHASENPLQLEQNPDRADIASLAELPRRISSGF